MAQSKTPVSATDEGLEKKANAYLITLDRYELNFRNLICNFLKDQYKNCLLLETGETRLVSLNVVRVLMSTSGRRDVVLRRFLGHTNQLQCEWHELVATASSSQHLHGMKNLLVCEVTKVEHLEQQENFFQKVSHFLKLAVKKKIIFVSPRSGTMRTFIKSIHEISKRVEMSNDFDESMTSDKKPTFDKISLFHAALNGSIDNVKQNLANGVKIDEQGGPKGGTALHAAAEKGHQNITIYLVKSHANVNIQDQDGNTPLHLATLGGHKEMINILLDNEANVLSKNGIGQTVLHIAAKIGNTELILLYVRREACVDAADNSGYTPLCLAVEHGHYDATLALLLNDADVNKAKHDGMTPIQYAEKNNNPEVVKLLKQFRAKNSPHT